MAALNGSPLHEEKRALSHHQSLPQTLPQNGTAQRPQAALNALVSWAQLMLQHRAQEVSLSTLVTLITKLSPLAEPITYRTVVTLSPHSTPLKGIRLLETGQVEISVYTPSLLSLEGPLPVELLQELLLQEQDGTTSLSDFIRLLTARFNELYTAAALSAQAAPQTSYAQLCLALLGANGDFTYQLSPAQLCGALSVMHGLDQGSAAALETLLSHALDCHVQIHERIFTMNPLPQGLRTALGRANCVLGREGMLGRHYPATQRRIRIILEPRNAAQCAALQPHQACGRYLQKLLALALGPRTLDCEVEYHLHKSAAVPTLLHGSCALGVNALLCRNASTAAAASATTAAATATAAATSATAAAVQLHPTATTISATQAAATATTTPQETLLPERPYWSWRCLLSFTLPPNSNNKEGS